MWIINSIAGAVINGALLPFRGVSPMVGLTVFSLVSDVAMLYVFKWTSDQEGLDLVKRKIYAGIFEIRLFNDDMRAILAAQRDILRYNLSYLRLSLRPLMSNSPRVTRCTGTELTTAIGDPAELATGSVVALLREPV